MPQLMELMGDDNPAVREKAWGILNALKPKDAAAGLMKLASDPRSQVACQAMSALAMIEAGENLPEFMKLLDSR